MIEDERRPVKGPVHEIGGDLSTLSIEELKERIALLKAEIGRLEAAIDAKQASRASADSVFRGGA